MADTSRNPATDTPAVPGRNRIVRTSVLVVTIVLCTVCCGLMLMLNPRSLAVDSVYQGF